MQKQKQRVSLAYCLVTYKTKAGVIETVWNSTSERGVPPEIRESTSGEMAAVDWSVEPDRRPDYVPVLGERVFVLMDEAARHRHASDILDDMQKRVPDDVMERVVGNFESRKDAVAFVADLLGENVCMDTVYVTKGWLDAFMKSREENPPQGEREEESASEAAIDLMQAITAVIGEQMRRKAMREIEDLVVDRLGGAGVLVFWNREGKKITVDEFVELRQDNAYVELAETKINDDVLVVTIWLGVAKATDTSSPPVFQTAIVHARSSKDRRFVHHVQRSYTTETEAFRGHAEIVARVRRQAS